MLKHATMAAQRKAAGCPRLEGQSFKIYDGYLTNGSPSGTVTIQDDGSYVVNIPGEPPQSGQLTRVNAKSYTYHEDGPPTVDGTLKCAAGIWVWSDEGGPGGLIQPSVS